MQQTDIVRRSRSVTTMDGTLHLHQTIKRGISVSLLEVRHETLMTIAQALTSPATVDYTDKTTGDRTGVVFYVSGPEATEKVIRGGNTYWSVVTFALEEK